MDRGELSAAIIQEVGTVFMGAVQEAASELLWPIATASNGGCKPSRAAGVWAGDGADRGTTSRPAGGTAPVSGVWGLLWRVERTWRQQVQGPVGDGTLQRPPYVCTPWAHHRLRQAHGLLSW